MSRILTVVRQVLRTIPLLIAVCLVSIPAQAQYGGGSGTTASAETNTYVFLLGQSTVVQTGGIAGVHWTYSVEGLFQLTVAPDAGTASFAHVDANATDDSPLRRTLDPNEVFNMTSLLGAVLDDTTISFTGKASDGSDVLITVTIEDDLAYLVGETIPPPNTADFFLFSLDAVAQRKYGGGSGEPNDPYLIYTAEHLNAIGADANDWDKHFKLMADIDLSRYTETDFNIIGIAWNNAFTGVFNGSGHTISNFSYTSTDTDYIGLFGYVDGEDALIKDLGLIDPNVDAGTGDRVGSLVGRLREGTITGCYVDGGSVSGNDYVGGLVGSNGGIITNCYDTGRVSGDEKVGGLVGYNRGTINNCYSVGRVTGTTDVGGLVGINWDTITNSFWDIETSGQAISAGGTGKTTAEMQMASTFVGWGCDAVWTIDEGKDYPRLWWENMPGEPPTTPFYGGGCGTEADPYLIYTAEQMNEIGLHEEDWDKHFKLMADIDLSAYTGTDFNIIRSFRGVFNGSGHTISDFSYISTETDTNAVGLFRYVDGENALIKDLGLIDPNVDGTYTLSYIFQYIGSLVGNLNEGTITGCYVDGGSVSGNDYVGGLVGDNWGGTITNCTLSASVSGNDSVGGLVGGTSRGTIADCYATGDVTGNDSVGGLVGKNNSTISNCSSEGSVSGNDEVGGLVGRNYGTITGCCVDGGSVLGTGWYVGGLVGSGGTITNCYSTTSVSGDRFVGGLVGDTRYSGRITCSYATSSVSGTGWYVGGLMGYNWGEVTDSFWDTQTSGQVTSGGGTGKTTAEMQTESTFTYAGWDFVGESTNGTEDIWWILEGRGYPRLWWELFAFSPDPHNGAFNVIQPLILSWVAGGSALQHDIYFGEDEEAVAIATTENLGIYRGRQARVLTTYDPGNLELGKTYYWRIDEYNTDATISKGNVWSFTVADFIVVDDFEDYNDFEPDRIFDTWIDGWGVETNGAEVGYADPDFLTGEHFVETTIVHSGSQSMPYFYDNNTAKYSEATMTLVWPRDWTQNGVGVLSLWFYGVPANAPEPMYVAIANYNGPTAVVYHDNPDAALIDTWTEWKIDLTKFSDQGVDLTDVDTISIGFGDKNPDVSGQPGGSGLVFFDDIRLYRPPELEPVQSMKPTLKSLLRTGWQLAMISG